MPVSDSYRVEHYQGMAARASVPRLVAAMNALLETIDHEPIRKAALVCGLPLYERAAAVKDAIAATEALANLAQLLDPPAPSTLSDHHGWAT